MIEILIAAVGFLLVVLGVVIYGSRKGLDLTINDETRQSEINVRRRQ